MEKDHIWNQLAISGLLLLGFLDISHVGTSSAPVDTSTVHSISLAHTDLETKAQDISNASTLPVLEDANTTHITTNDSVADSKIKPTQDHVETTAAATVVAFTKKPDTNHIETTAAATVVAFTKKPDTSKKDPQGITEQHLTTTKHGNGHLEVSATNAGMTDPPGTIKQHLSTIKHGNGHTELPVTDEPEKQTTIMTATIETKHHENSSMNATGIIIGCFVGLFIILIIFALITILRKKKLNSYSFEPPNKSPDEAGIPLNNVKA
ncbi:uncharacterized protein [Eleutherodactylus coqui]|uniref:uncharacterized protein isoform X1 n=1 Tax=Eleutherodactylus coqui TaxID=57060 RepID=UPI003462DB2F